MLCMPCAVYNLNFSASGRLFSYGRQGCILVAYLNPLGDEQQFVISGTKTRNQPELVGLRQEVYNGSVWK